MADHPPPFQYTSWPDYCGKGRSPGVPVAAVYVYTYVHSSVFGVEWTWPRRHRGGHAWDHECGARGIAVMKKMHVAASQDPAVSSGREGPGAQGEPGLRHHLPLSVSLTQGQTKEAAWGDPLLEHRPLDTWHTYGGAKHVAGKHMGVRL